MLNIMYHPQPDGIDVLLILMLLGGVFIGIPASIGLVFYWRRSRQKQATQKRGLKLHD